MKSADVLVLPYDDVLTSGSVLLSMSFGKPIIAPRIGCIPEVLDDQGSFLYYPNEEEGLLQAMQRALEANLDMMGQYNYNKARSFDWKGIAKQTYEVYCRC